MTTLFLSGDEPGVKDIVRKAFPFYHGKRWSYSIQDSTHLCNTYWDEGSRYSYVMMRMDDHEIRMIPHFDPPQFGGPDLGEHAVQIPPGFVLVELREGFYEKLHLYVNPADAPKLIAAPVELTPDQVNVLMATRCLKNSYGGQSDIRFNHVNKKTGITREQWEKTQAELVSMKLLNKAFAITPAGRNAVAHLNSTGFLY